MVRRRMATAAAAAEEEEKILLAVVHQHVLQAGYSRSAKLILQESRQKTLPSSPVPLKEMYAEWKKIQTKKQKAADRKRKTPAKIRVPDPKSSSESSEEEEVTNVPKTNVPANNSSVVNAESSSEDEDSSSEEEAVPEKTVKTSVTRSKPSDFLQLAAQKTNSFPGKGVAVASVQAKGQQNKASVNKLLSPAVAKVGQNEVLSGKLGPASQSPVVQGLNVVRAAASKTAGASKSSSSSSSSESEEEKTLKVVKTPPPSKPAQKEAESSSEDSSDDSDSEGEGGATASVAKAATIQLKPGVQSAQLKTTLAKSLPASTIRSKGSSVKVSPAKTPANQIRSETVNAGKSTKPTESSETSDSSDSEDAEPSSVAQTKSPRKIPQAATAVVTNVSASKPSSKTVSSPLKQTPKPSLSKPPTPSKKAESSESDESSSESEDETQPVPVSQKGLQTPQHLPGAKQNQADKTGNQVKAASSILKGKEAESESSSSSDSEDETVPAALKSLQPSATKANTPAQPAAATKSLPLPVSLQEAQQSEDSSQDSSDESDSEEDKAFTQKLSQVAQKPVPVAVKASNAKSASVTPGKAGSAQSAGKGTANTTKSAAASLQKASEISETDSSESSNSEPAAKPAKQPPIHPFFKQVAGKAASASGKGAQVNSGTSESVSSKCQSPAKVITGKVEQNSSKKAKPSQDQDLPSKPSGLIRGKESSGSSSSSDSEEEEAVTASATVKQIPQPGLAQKGGVIKEVESSSEESSDEDQEEPSQSLLAGASGPFKTSTSTVLKTASSMLSKQTPGKAGNPTLSALTKSSGKSAIADSSTSDSSDSDTDAEGTIAQKAEITSLPASWKQTVVAKGATGKGTVAGEKTPGRNGSKASTAKKATAKTQSNGKAKGTPVANLPLTLLAKVHPAEIDSKSNEEVVAQVPGIGAQESTGGATPIVATKTPKATKISKSVENKKPSKKRKLAAGEAILGEPKEKKQKEQSILDMLTKKKKKKKSKSSNITKPPKNKDGKEKKSDKKKKKSKKLESLSEDGSQKKKKKKKKTGDLERAA